MDPLISYLIIINALGLFLMLLDKYKAIENLWRIPERTLLGVALVGGSLGALMGMYLFRHKTRHPVFSIGLPILLICHILLLILL